MRDALIVLLHRVTGPSSRPLNAIESALLVTI